MRFWPIVLVLAALGACKLPGTTGGTGGTTTGTGTGGAGGASSCNTAMNCADCKMCALATPCAALFSACELDPDCSAIDQCFQSNCGGIGATCLDGCYANNPNGMSAYQTVNQCVYCKECPTQCPGQCM